MNTTQTQELTARLNATTQAGATRVIQWNHSHDLAKRVTVPGQWSRRPGRFSLEVEQDNGQWAQVDHTDDATTAAAWVLR